MRRKRYQATGDVREYKAHLNGYYRMVKGLDYTEAYAPVTT